MLLFRFVLLLSLALIEWSYATDEQPSKYYNQIVVLSNCEESCYSHYSQYEKVTCFCSLSDALNCKPIVSHTLILIKKTFNILTDEVKKLTNLTDIMIKGQGSRNITVQCNHLLFGFVFDSVSQLRLHNFKFIGCGFRRNEIWTSPVAIMIHNCTNVIIQDVEITNSISLGLLLSNVTGYIEVKGSNFTYNGQGNISLLVEGIKIMGGGMAISSNDTLQHSHYSISGCRFVNNLKSFMGKPSNNYGEAHGGGLLVYIKHTRGNQTLNIHDCIFEGNEAGCGGGAAIKLMDNKNTDIEMNRLIFQQNKATNSTISNGGGLEIYSTTGTSKKSISRSIIVLNGSHFELNTANFGGGLSIDCGSSASINEVNISNCNWTRNSARSGFAVDVSRHFTIALSLDEKVIQPIFANCSFKDNHVFILSKHSFKAGFGAVSVLEVKVEFHSYLLFEANIGSALSAVMSTITFKNCNASFLNNNSTYGGAVSLNFASLLLRSQTKINFEGNNATEYGGAIYSFITNGHMLYSRQLCPILFSCNNGSHIPECCQDVHVTFINNNATRGSSIYLPSLFPCVLEYSADVHNLIDHENVFQQDSFTFTGKLSTEVATAVAKQDPYEGNMTVYSGEQSNLNLTLKDESNNPVPLKSVIFEAIIVNKSDVSVTLKNTYINNGIFTIFGPENSNAIVVFQTMFKPLLHIVREIHIDYCPPGFKYNKIQNSCVCSWSSFYGIISCNSTTENFRATIVKGIWCGYLNQSSTNRRVFVSSPCSFFCRSNIGRNYLPIPSKLYQHQDFQCQGKRTGILCGKCKPGYTVYYHRNNHLTCAKKSKYCLLKGIFIFLMAEIIPITLVFGIIIFTGFDVTSGYTQSFLLYSHILCSLSITRAIDLSPLEYTVYWYFIHIFYFPLMLKFFYFKKLSFCIFNNANNMDIISLGYLKGLYCVLLIIIIVLFLKCFSQRCHCCNRFLRFTTAKNSALIGISALFVLFFTCAIEISLLILQLAPLYGEGYNILSYRVAFYGELSYFDSRHLRYALPAITFLVVLLVPSFMLLLYPLVTSVLSYFDIDASESWIGCILTKGFMYKHLKPFYDRFYSSFRDKHRYFAGMYFVYRLLIQLSYYIPNYTESAFIMETLLVIFLVLHSIIQPYQNKHQNTLETLLLSNLIIINGITCGDMIIVYDNAHNHFWKVNIASSCQAILAVLPMILALSYIAWKYVLSRVWLKLKNLCNILCHKNRSEYEEILHDDQLEHGRHRSVSLQNHSN